MADLIKDIRCPMEYTLRILSGKWRPRIICALAAKENARYSDIKKAVPGITDKALTVGLAELIQLELAEKIPISEEKDRPVYAYNLTVAGIKLGQLFLGLCDWGIAYTPENVVNSFEFNEYCVRKDLVDRL